MIRTVLFQLHWLLGVTAGVVLAIMGVTGAMISFEDEILDLLNPGVMTVAVSSRPLLPPSVLATRVEAQRPGAQLTRLVVHSDRSKAAQVRYIAEGGDRSSSYVDPYDGRLLGAGAGHETFEFITRLHRWLALPGEGNGIGGQITGFAALSLIYFALSGLYLRWPRAPLDWRNWLVLDLRKTGRNLHRALHAVVGGWVLIFYLMSALTGLWWSYDWYRAGARHLLTGPAALEAAGPSKAPLRKRRPDLATAWAGFERATEARPYAMVTATLRNGGDVEFRAKLPGGRHDRVSDELTIDGLTGATLAMTAYSDRTPGQDVIVSVYEIHRGAYFGLAGRIAVTIASLTMPLFTITGFLLYFARRRRKRALASVITRGASAPSALESGTLVAFASQTGTAERLARLTADALPGATILPLSRLDDEVLGRMERVFLVVSTYGEGEPPDGVAKWARRLSSTCPDLSHLSYAVLALGDREYDDFCAFGHRLDQWLHGAGARRLFDLVEMDGDAADAQRQWQRQLSGFGARTDQTDWAPAPMGDWRLAGRRLLNPGSSGEPAFQIVLEPPPHAPVSWRPGDILEVTPRHDPRRIDAFLAAHGAADTPELRDRLSTSVLPRAPDAPFATGDLSPLAHREYSIASIEPSGRVELIVRQCNAEDGFLGLGSGWLTRLAPLESVVRARIRSNPAFHPPADASTPMILIGNGTGLAGLLAHARQRAYSGGGPIALFWGERSPDHDAFHADELNALVRSGSLAHLSLSWSRQAQGRAYVQDGVAAAKRVVVDYVAQGAVIYVCGSAGGMAPAVHAVLADILSADLLEDMAEHGRYRRDIY